MTEHIVDIVADTMKLSDKPAVICTVVGSFTTKVKQLFEERQLPVYPSPERSVRALSMLWKRNLLQSGVAHVSQ